MSPYLHGKVGGHSWVPGNMSRVGKAGIHGHSLPIHVWTTGIYWTTELKRYSRKFTCFIPTLWSEIKEKETPIDIPVALGGTCPSDLHGGAVGLEGGLEDNGDHWSSEEAALLVCCTLPQSVCLPGSFAFVELGQWLSSDFQVPNFYYYDSVFCPCAPFLLC